MHRLAFICAAIFVTLTAFIQFASAQNAQGSFWLLSGTTLKPVNTSWGMIVVASSTIDRLTTITATTTTLCLTGDVCRTTWPSSAAITDSFTHASYAGLTTSATTSALRTTSLLAASTTFFTYSSTTQFTNSGDTYLTGTLSSLLSTDSTGKVTATTSIGSTYLKAAGSDTQLQFNDGGRFGGDSALTWDKSTNQLTLDDANHDLIFHDQTNNIGFSASSSNFRFTFADEGNNVGFSGRSLGGFYTAFADAGGANTALTASSTNYVTTLADEGTAAPLTLKQLGKRTAIFDSSPILTTDKTFTLPNLTGTFALGTGAANRAAYWDSANSITSDADFLFDGTKVTFTSASSTNFSVSNSTHFSYLTSALLGTDSNGKLVATTTLGGSLFPSAITFDNEWDTEGEVEIAWGSVNIILATEIDSCSELATIMAGETGTCGSLVLSASPTFTGKITATAASTTDISASNSTHFSYLPSALLATDANGKLVSTTTIGIGLIAGAPTGANPTGTVGLSTVNGSATTFLRSDGAPALSQAIAPTWTALHVFSANASSSQHSIYKGYFGGAATTTLLAGGQWGFASTTPAIQWGLTIATTTMVQGAQIATSFASSTTGSGTILVNWNSGNKQRFILSGNATFVFNSTSSNPQDGAVYVPKICQDPTGSRTVSFVGIALRWGEATTTVSSGANSCSSLLMIYDAQYGIYTVHASTTGVRIN